MPKILREPEIQGPLSRGIRVPLDSTADMKAHDRLLDATGKRGKPGLGFPREEAIRQAAAVLSRAKAHFPDLRMLIAGSIRRECAFSHDIDILVCGPRAALEDFRTWAESFGKDAGEILWSGPEKVSVRGTAMQIDFRLILPEHWGPSLQYFTGSRRHNIMVRATAKRRGLLVNEYGVFTRETGRRVDDNTEGGIYRVVGLKWLPPKYREERGDEHAD